MNDDILLDKYDDFRIIYLDIVRGYSYCEELGCYVKHLTDFDMSVVTSKKRAFEAKEKADGLMPEKEKLKAVLLQGEWSEEKEDEIETLRLIISDNTKLIENMGVPEQKKVIQGIVDGKKKELNDLVLDRTSLLYPTLEMASLEYYLEMLPQYCLFKNVGLTDPLHTPEEYEDVLSEEDVSKINKLYLKSTHLFSDRNMRVLSVMPFVINQISYCKKNIMSFLDKPIIDFSSHQMDIYSRTTRNLSILEHAEGDPPDIDTKTTIQEMLDWYDLNYSIWLGKNKNQDSAAIRTSKTYEIR